MSGPEQIQDEEAERQVRKAHTCPRPSQGRAAYPHPHPVILAGSAVTKTRGEEANLDARESHREERILAPEIGLLGQWCLCPAVPQTDQGSSDHRAFALAVPTALTPFSRYQCGFLPLFIQLPAQSPPHGGAGCMLP